MFSRWLSSNILKIKGEVIPLAGIEQLQCVVSYVVLCSTERHAQPFHLFPSDNPVLTPCPASSPCWLAAFAVYKQRARRPVCRLRQEDHGPLLPAGRGQTVAYALPQMLRVQTQPGVWTHLFQQGRKHLLQGGLLQVESAQGLKFYCVRNCPLDNKCWEMWLGLRKLTQLKFDANMG